MSKLVDITNQKFGRLTALSILPKKEEGVYWVCLCDCGSQYIALGTSLRYGSTKSCGCLQKEAASIANKTHGKTRTRIHDIWKGMIRRCTNEKSNYYNDYGGRGISVCDRWLKFENFYADMGDAPEGRSIDRIDNNGNYEPENCRWATLKQQANNTRRNIFIEFRGESKTISQWAEEIGVTHNHIKQRLKLGWSIEKALTIPINKHKKLNDVCVKVIKYLHENGFSKRRLAKAHKVSRIWIDKALIA